MSGSRTTTTSASETASATESTRRPASCAFCRDEEPSRERDPDVDSGLREVERVRVALRPVADDGDLATPDQVGVGVALVVKLGHRVPLYLSAVFGVAGRCLLIGVGLLGSCALAHASDRRCGAAVRPLELRQCDPAGPLELRYAVRP